MNRAPRPQAAERERDGKRRCPSCRFDANGTLVKTCRGCFARGITQAEFSEKRRRNR